MKTVTVKAAYDGQLLEQKDVLLLFDGAKVISIDKKAIADDVAYFIYTTREWNQPVFGNYSLEFYEVKTDG